MLVLVPGEEISSVHVSPVPVGWEVLKIEVIPGFLGALWNVSLSVLSNSQASFGLLIQEGLGLGIANRVGTVSAVVCWVVLLSVSGLVSFCGGPGVGWSGPGAVALNGKVVLSSDELHEALFSPVSTPRVSNEPVWSSIFLAESNKADLVDNIDISGGVLKDSRSVVLHGISHGDSARNWASLVDLLHHVLLA